MTILLLSVALSDQTCSLLTRIRLVLWDHWHVKGGGSLFALVIPVRNIWAHWLGVCFRDYGTHLLYEPPVGRQRRGLWAPLSHSAKPRQPPDMWQRWWKEAACAEGLLCRCSGMWELALRATQYPATGLAVVKHVPYLWGQPSSEEDRCRVQLDQCSVWRGSSGVVHRARKLHFWSGLVQDSILADG